MTSNDHDQDLRSQIRKLRLEMRSEIAFFRLSCVLFGLWLAAKSGFKPDQPRDDHGRWTSGGGGSDGGGGFGTTFTTDPTGDEAWSGFSSTFDETGALTGQDITFRDGGSIQSEFDPSGDGTGWDERHTVATLDGTRIAFESTAGIQTIADAATGDVISASTWTPRVEPDATVQPVFAPQAYAAEKAAEAAIMLYVWMSSQNSVDRTAVLGFRADDYLLGAEPKDPAIWVGRLTVELMHFATPTSGPRFRC